MTRRKTLQMPGGRVRGWLLALALVTPTGCTTYDTQYVFDPRPVELAASVHGFDDPETPVGEVRSLVSVMGIRRADVKAGVPTSIEVRIRLENGAPATATLDAASLVLYTADLQRLPEPILRPAGPVAVGAGATSVVTAFFPFPGGRYPAGFDLDGLSLRWAVDVGGGTYTASASFTRRPWAYYDRYPSRIGVGFGRWCD